MTMKHLSLDVVYGICRGLPSGCHTHCLRKSSRIIRAIFFVFLECTLQHCYGTLCSSQFLLCGALDFFNIFTVTLPRDQLIFDCNVRIFFFHLQLLSKSFMLMIGIEISAHSLQRVLAILQGEKLPLLNLILLF